MARGRCHSKVGRSGGRQLLSLGYGCHDVGSTLHELCHAIGLYHEHMRYDRDQYLNIEWENIQPIDKVPISQYRPAAKFDYNSIMIYGSKAFSRNGRNTMTPRNRETKIIESHFKQSLARSDVININTLYGCNI
ncbi:hypothetical protein BLOT_003251 [Blomia tropicalis]|nr:hypothetical protein BLOT_003251 [Blomia tropicalis]